MAAENRPIKILLVGDNGVGKTTMLSTYGEYVFPNDYRPRVLDALTQDVTVDGEVVTVCLWDSVPGEDYERLRPLSYPETDVFVMVYTINDGGNSLENLKTYWKPELNHHCPDAKLIVVGNKLDLAKSTAGKLSVPRDWAQEIARDVAADAWLECSATTQEGLSEVFVNAVRLHKGGKKKAKAVPCCVQ